MRRSAARRRSPSAIEQKAGRVERPALLRLMRIAIAALTMLSAAVLPAAAEQLAERLAPCFACHGEKGQSGAPEVPALGAQAAPYTLIPIYLFPEKQRGFEPMNATPQRLSGGDLRGRAAF